MQYADEELVALHREVATLRMAKADFSDARRLLLELQQDLQRYDESLKDLVKWFAYWEKEAGT